MQANDLIHLIREIAIGVGSGVAIAVIAIVGFLAYGALSKRFSEWRERRHWQKRHLQFIRTQVMQDWRWLAVDPVGKAITDRYEKLTASDWYKLDHEPIEQFRKRIGMEPNYKKDPSHDH